MPAADLACERIAARQCGVISRTQALAHGLTERGIRHRVAAGRWERVFPGVYRPRPVPPSWSSDLMAALLWAGPTAVVSHRAAGRVWGLDGLDAAPLEITLPRNASVDGVIVHRRLPAAMPPRRSLRGLPVTSIERTLLDLAAVSSPRIVGTALDDALRRHLTTLARVRRRLDSDRRQGRRGALLLARILQAREGIPEQVESELELRLFRLLRRAKIPLPKPQWEVRVGKRLVARLDFAYPELRLGIEAHGFRWHGTHEQWRRDVRRENRLKRLGWVVLVFSWDDVVAARDVVVRDVRAMLAALASGEGRDAARRGFAQGVKG